MKWSGSLYALRCRQAAAPWLLLALSACSSPNGTSSPPLLVDSELGRPLATTVAGATQVERQRGQAAQQTRQRPQRPVPRAIHGHDNVAGPAASSPLGDQPVQLNFVDADIQAVVRALSRSTGRQFLVDPRVKGTLTLVSEGQVPAR